jgi:hypothetical protein
MNGSDSDLLEALPELPPPPELEANVLELSLSALGDAAGKTHATAFNVEPAVSRSEDVVHGAVVAAYFVYAAVVAIGVLDRVLF